MMKTVLSTLLVFCLCWGVGCSKNLSEFESFEETKARAEKGDDIAQVNLGYMYANGEGVLQDLHEAAKWYRKAADQGHANAQYNLGVMYDNGEGVERNFVNGYAWWNIAASNGEQNAKNSLPQLVKLMTREQIAEGQKLSREMIAKNPKLMK